MIYPDECSIAKNRCQERQQLQTRQKSKQAVTDFLLPVATLLDIMSIPTTGPVSSGKPLIAGSSRKATPADLTRKVNPSTTRRIVTTIAFPLLIFLAVPYWWYVTSIVRLPLPIARIEALESSTVSDLSQRKLIGSHHWRGQRSYSPQIRIHIPNRNMRRLGLIIRKS
jgi:hypothetical protein